MHTIADKIGFFLARQNHVSSEEREIYSYGAEVILTTGSFICIALLVGFAIGRLEECILFLVAFFPIRSFAGGYHAPTTSMCLVVSIGYMLISFALSTLLTIASLVYVVTAALIIVFVCAPVVHPNSPHSQNHCKVLRIKARAIACMEWGLPLLLCGYYPHVAFVLGATYFIAACSTFVAAVQRRFGIAEYGKE